MNILRLSFLLTILISASICEAQTPLWTRTNGPGGSQINEISFDSSGGAYVGSNGTYRTTDGGVRWTELPSGLSAIHTLPNGKLVAIQDNTISISADNGSTWTVILDTVGSIAVTTSSEIYVANRSHLFRSADEGATWQTLSAPPLQGRLYAFNTATVFLLGGDWRTGTSGMYRSTDHGQNWSKVINGISVNNDYGDCLAGTANGVMCYVNRDDRSFSTDDGRTWEGTNFFNDIAPLVAISPNGKVGVSVNSSLEMYDAPATKGATISTGFPVNDYSDDLNSHALAV